MLSDADLILWALGNGWFCRDHTYHNGDKEWIWDMPTVAGNYYVPRTSNIPELSDELREVLKGQRDAQ